MNELVQTAYNVFTDEYGYMYGYDWNAIVTAEGNRTGNKHVVYDFDGTFRTPSEILTTTLAL